MLRRAATLLPSSLRLAPQLQLQRGYAELVTGSDPKVRQLVEVQGYHHPSLQRG